MFSMRNFIVTLACFSSLSFALTPEELRSRVVASTLAAAAGDALGRGPEIITISLGKANNSVEPILKAYPNLLEYEDFDGLPEDEKILKNGKKVFIYTDDTAMARLVFDRLNWARNFNWNTQEIMGKIAQSFVADMNSFMMQDSQGAGWACSLRAPGNTCLHSVRILKDKITIGDQERHGNDWWKVGKEDQFGCGSVMRAHPFGLVYADDIKKAKELAQEHSCITHGSHMAQASCAAMAEGVAYALRGTNPWEIAQEMYKTALEIDINTAQKIQEAITYAKENCDYKKFDDLFEISKPVFVKFKGWNADDALAAALYIFLLCHDNLQRALTLGVIIPGDCDSVASMAGALVGAYIGMDQIPDRWETQLEDHNQLKDMANKAAQKLIDQNAASLQLNGYAARFDKIKRIIPDDAKKRHVPVIQRQNVPQQPQVQKLIEPVQVVVQEHRTATIVRPAQAEQPVQTKVPEKLKKAQKSQDMQKQSSFTLKVTSVFNSFKKIYEVAKKNEFVVKIHKQLDAHKYILLGGLASIVTGLWLGKKR